MGEKTSYRQAGKEISGKLFKGPVVDAYNRLSQPSIPTKIEQILTIPSHYDGFNSSAQRFTTSSILKMPGPGDYEPKKPTSSTNKKGFYVSNSSRFKKLQYTTSVPGPGTYNQKSYKPNPITINGRARTTERTLQIPSPGYYEPKKLESEREITSMFKSSTKRMKSNDLENPTPWQYNPNKPKSSGYVTAPFVQPSSCRREQVNLYDPHAKPVIVTTPGPGEYNLEILGKIKPSSMFLATEVDRFGKPMRRKTKNMVPGPGEYSLQHESHKALVTGAVFLSESKRGWISAKKKPPGPAFYSPLPIAKRKSFHYKTAKVWI